MCFIIPAFTRGKLCVLPWDVSHVPWDVACDGNWLREEQSTLTAVQKSVPPMGGIGGSKQTLLFGSMDELGTRPAIERAGVGQSRPKRKKELMLCRP